MVELPRFAELPLRKGDPPHSAWGLYGNDDQLGTLNRLTDDVVLNAANKEIQTGTRSVVSFGAPASSETMCFSVSWRYDHFGSKER